MELFTVAFFGHRYVDNILAVEDKLEDIILTLMNLIRQFGLFCLL